MSSAALATAAALDPEAELQNTIAGFYGDPLSFVLFAFDWGVGDLEGHEGPDIWQTEVLKALANDLPLGDDAIRYAAASGHGIGKGALAAWITLWAMSTRPHLNGTVSANTGSQLSTKTWRELAIWHKRVINRHWFDMTATKFFKIDHPETWFVAAIPWSLKNPEAFAGLHGDHVLAIYDEASSIPDEIWEVSEGAMTSPRAMWFVFGNPTRPAGRFRECFGRFKHRWRTWQIDSRDARMANRDQLRQWVEDYGEDSDFVRIRVRGIFPRAGAIQLIGVDAIDEAQSREPHGEGARIMGVDVARFGDDQTVVIERTGDKVEILARWRNLDTMQTAARVAEIAEAQEPHALFIEGVGVGGGVVDRLKQLGVRVVEVNPGSPASDPREYTNLRAEMWAKMRNWLKGGGCLPDDRELADDLTAPEYGFDSKNRLQLEKKSDMKRRGLSSPDSGDALALTFAAPVRARDNLAERLTGARTRLAGGSAWMGA